MSEDRQLSSSTNYPVRLGSRSVTGAAHWAYFDQKARLVVEWYDHGPNAPYESANLLIFDRAASENLARLIGVGPEACGQDLLGAIANRFDSWFAFKAFVNDRHIPYSEETDFCP